LYNQEADNQGILHIVGVDARLVLTFMRYNISEDCLKANECVVFYNINLGFASQEEFYSMSNSSRVVLSEWSEHDTSYLNE
jgi:hypothetical protein